MIECTKNELVKGKNFIEPEGKSTGEITLSSCTLYHIHSIKESLAASCEVPTLKFAYKDLLIVGPGGLIEDEFKPAVGENFFTIEIKGANCTLKGTFETKGAFVASLGDEGGVLKTSHELVFASTGSKIKFGKEPLSFTNRISIELADGASWLYG